MIDDGQRTVRPLRLQLVGGFSLSGQTSGPAVPGGQAARLLKLLAVHHDQQVRAATVVEVLWPDGPGSPGEDPNQRAVVLLVSYGELDVLLTADAEADVTTRLRLPPVEVLKVAHHGSADPLLSELLDRIRPRIAVISVGRGNDYGHPTPSTLATLERQPGVDVYRTDLDGAVTVESDGRRLGVSRGG